MVTAGRPVGRRWRRFAVPGLVLVAAAGFVFALTTGSGPAAQRAPHFSFPRLGGGSAVAYPLTGADAHRAVVLSFFASWCSPCRTELPTIASVADHARTASPRVVFVGIDGNDEPASGLAFARKSGVTFAVGADADSALAPRLGLVGYPDTVFIDASGTVAGVVHGPVTRAVLQSWVARLSSA